MEMLLDPSQFSLLEEDSMFDIDGGNIIMGIVTAVASVAAVVAVACVAPPGTKTVSAAKVAASCIILTGTVWAM